MERGAEKLPRFRIPGIVDIRVTSVKPFIQRSDNFHMSHAILLEAKRKAQAGEGSVKDVKTAQKDFKEATDGLTRPKHGIEVVIFGGAVRRKLR